VFRVFREERSEVIAGGLRDLWEQNYIKNKRYILAGYDLSQTVEIRDGPALCIGAGPSLQKNIKDIKKGLYKLVACDKTCPKLVDLGIVPEYVVALNAAHTDVQKWLEPVSRPGVTLIVPCGVHPETYEGWKGSIQWINAIVPTGLHMRIWHETLSGLVPRTIGSNAGTFAYLMAAEMGFNPVAYIGMDFSFLTREEVMRKYITHYEDHLKVPVGSTWPWPPISEWKPCKVPVYAKQYNVMEMTDIMHDVRWLDIGWWDMAQAFQSHVKRMREEKGTMTYCCVEGGINASRHSHIMSLKEFNDMLEGKDEDTDNGCRHLGD